MRPSHDSDGRKHGVKNQDDGRGKAAVEPSSQLRASSSNAREDSLVEGRVNTGHGTSCQQLTTISDVAAEGCGTVLDLIGDEEDLDDDGIQL